MRTVVAIALAATFAVGCAAPQKHRTRTQQQSSGSVTVRGGQPAKDYVRPQTPATGRVSTRPAAPAAPPAVVTVAPPASRPASSARATPGPTTSGPHLAPQLDP